MLPPVALNLSGERFRVVYRLAGGEAEAYARAQGICVEQTIEFPAELAPPGDIHDHIVGRLEAFRPLDAAHCEAVISYAVETAGLELTQLTNVIFGNASLQPGIRVERLELPATLLAAFRGPRFGRAGLRAWLGVPQRPLLATALKPLGLPAAALADLAYQFALGGIDIIKDDHGLADQLFAPYRERVERCVEAVERAGQQAGYRCAYVANVTAPADQVYERALLARKAGARGLLVAPGLVGLDTMRQLADDDGLALPILSHPAFQGSFVTSADSGLAHGVVFGQMARLAGADASIYPNYGGRFSFSREECRAIAEGTVAPMGHIKPIFPAPGGGMSLARIPEMLESYGREVILLIGGGLHQHGPDLAANCRTFRQLVEQI
ncbi:MAG: RuBisCO large subunit C-terminal-like domain-containing protein [Chloroflexi bacterium]|nr:RuBisCO large subunit C-terminal-like domain-containing protein [Chloroflexota bacterium]MCI0579470.1 RuBisCO large subunit C-terminal-like domain-containing protein [Chloroflexota bacterium]MCI0644923.1 RuBisCO large subunit C-terminal-like domain-containing protein [Chloroflexota bacterium]MCI0729692.1 RuBisCO large subunit C-terminal-like domain-containing protein [Chloroflexota bacterium]